MITIKVRINGLRFRRSDGRLSAQERSRLIGERLKGSQGGRNIRATDVPGRTDQILRQRQTEPVTVTPLGPKRKSFRHDDLNMVDYRQPGGWVTTDLMLKMEPVREKLDRYSYQEAVRLLLEQKPGSYHKTLVTISRNNLIGPERIANIGQLLKISGSIMLKKKYIGVRVIKFLQEVVRVAVDSLVENR